MKRVNSLTQYPCTTAYSRWNPLDLCKGCCNNMQTVALWNNFCYAHLLIWSHAHLDLDNNGSPELMSIIEVFNGEVQTVANTSVVCGKWPFLKGAVFHNDCNLPCSAVYANQDVTKGDTLIIDYRDLKPYEFFLRYGTIPCSMTTNSETVDKMVL